MALAVVLSVDDDDEGAPEAKLAAPLRAAEDRTPRGSDQATNARWRVLVAEDDSELRRSLVDLFELPGYTVLEAADGEQAIDRLADSPDVMVLDLHMPKRDGLAVLEELGEPPPLVILYSAFSLYHAEQLEERGVRSRVFRAFRKPVPPAQLLHAVADAIAELGGEGGA